MLPKSRKRSEIQYSQPVAMEFITMTSITTVDAKEEIQRIPNENELTLEPTRKYITQKFEDSSVFSEFDKHILLTWISSL